MATKTDLTEKQKALDLVMKNVERTFSTGAIMRLGDATRMQIETIPTGALPLDLALGGGLSRGRVIEVYFHFEWSRNTDCRTRFLGE